MGFLKGGGGRQKADENTLKLYRRKHIFLKRKPTFLPFSLNNTDTMVTKDVPVLPFRTLSRNH